MYKDLFFDLESNDSAELEYNSDVSVDFLASEENCTMSNEDIAELREELVRLEKLKDV